MTSGDKLGAIFFSLAAFLVMFITTFGLVYSWHVSDMKVEVQIACIDAGMEWDESYDGQCVKDASND